MLSVPDFDDYCHILSDNQHEAFFFQFASDDGQTYGILRTLFGTGTVLEIVVVRLEGQTWLYQRGGPLAGAPGPVYDASGPLLTLLCLQPWTSWRCYFDGQLVELASGYSAPFRLDLQFFSTAPPARYVLGPYQHIQQDGRLEGSFKLGGREYHGPFVCSRDHTWGQRQMHIAQSWVVASLPAHLYLAVINPISAAQPMHLGHRFSSDGQQTLWQAPMVTTDDNGWQIQEAEMADNVWQARRAMPAVGVYLGPPGCEAVRRDPQPGDLYYDELGPTLYTAADGRRYMGFLEHARRIT